jgi:NAD(P)-dependent dehydrogenase (short-subunit alcohol dehydrogenase family)
MRSGCPVTSPPQPTGRRWLLHGPMAGYNSTKAALINLTRHLAA